MPGAFQQAQNVAQNVAQGPLGRFGKPYVDIMSMGAVPLAQKAIGSVGGLGFWNKSKAKYNALSDAEKRTVDNWVKTHGTSMDEAIEMIESLRAEKAQ
jgi:hypothetical protein